MTMLEHVLFEHDDSVTIVAVHMVILNKEELNLNKVADPQPITDINNMPMKSINMQAQLVDHITLTKIPDQ
jgi:hypothetical protein